MKGKELCGKKKQAYGETMLTKVVDQVSTRDFQNHYVGLLSNGTEQGWVERIVNGC